MNSTNKTTYVKSLHLASYDWEVRFFTDFQRSGYYSSPYPFGLFVNKMLKREETDPDMVFTTPVTLFYGDNGSGKSTLLNILASLLDIPHNSPFNASVFMKEYVKGCRCSYNYEAPPLTSKIITSDDVFNQSFHRREMNQMTHERQMETLEEGRDLIRNRKRTFNFDNPEDLAYIERRKVFKHDCDYRDAHRLVLKEIGRDIALHSNGENALEYFEGQISRRGLYLLDEPENSLSINHQLLLKQYIEEMVEYEQCQFIISTHSPFLLALNNARIYNLNLCPVDVQRWTDIEEVKTYFRFFQQYANQFPNTENTAL